MKYVISSETIENRVNYNIHTLNLDIEKHQSNLKTIKQSFDEFLANDFNFSKFIVEFQGDFTYSVREDLSQSILNELSLKHKELVDSIEIAIIYGGDYILNKDEYKEITLNGNKLYIKIKLSHNVYSLIEKVKELEKIKDKCRYVKEFILNEEEYQFIFGE